jgi:hypothetical protein
MSDISLQPREVWKQLGRLPVEGRLGSSENTQASRGVVIFLLLAWPSLHMCHLFGIRNLVFLSAGKLDIANEEKKNSRATFTPTPLTSLSLL